MGMDRSNNWPAAVGIFTGILAKEAVVGTLDAMYSSIAVDRKEFDEYEGFDLLRGLQEAFATIPENLAGLVGTFADPLGMEVGDLSDLKAVSEKQDVTMTTFPVMRSLFPSGAAVVAYLLFILLYTPCVAALGAIYRETGVGWTMFVAVWTFFLGYAVATLYYQFSLLAVQPAITLGWTLAMVAVMALVFMAMRKAGENIMPKAKLTEGCGNSKGCSC